MGDDWLAGVWVLLVAGYVLVLVVGWAWLALQVVGVLEPGPIPWLP